MKRTIKFIVIAIVGLLNIQIAKSQDKELSVKLSEPLKPGKLKIDLFNGSIKIIGYSGKEVAISADGPYLPGKGDQKPVKNNSKKIEEYVMQQNNLVSINVDKPLIMNLILKVPKNFLLVLKVSTAGNIYVENVDGDQEISVISGNITIIGANGSVLANNTKGNIKARLNILKPNAAIALSSVVSTVELTAPANMKANVRLQSDFGTVNADFDVSEGSPGAKSNSIMVHRVTGKVNGGGANIFMKSVGGNIELRKDI